MNCRLSIECRFLVLAMLAVGASVGVGHAQTVRPVIIEYKGSAKGKLELVNNSFQPTNVVIEPRSFTIKEDGDGIYGPLAKDIHLKLSSMSLRIPPKQSRYVFYEAKADALPAWFVIYSVFAGPVHQSGLNIQLDLPHTVYLLQKEPLERPDVNVESLSYQPDKHRVVIVVANKSAKLGRALEWQVTSKGTKAGGSGFPLLPQSRRQLEVAWNAPDPPATFSIHFEHFSFKEDFSARQK